MNKLYSFRGYILAALALLLLAIPGVGFPSRQTLDQSTSSASYFMLWAPFVLSETLFLLAVLLRIQARRSIGEHTRGSSHDANELVTWGVYSRIRHPLYLSNTGIGVSFALFHLGFSWETILFVAVLVMYEIVLSRLEDRYLENRFQDLWRNWMSVTPAFVPIANKRSPRDGSGAGKSIDHNSGATRSFLQSFKADKSTWIWLCVFIVLLVLRKVL